MAQHISVRIPWHDNGYDGTVCKKPCENSSCLRLKNIFENRDDAAEAELAGQKIKGHENDIPCLGEGGAFMSPHELVATTIHPYAKTNSKTHGHFRETQLVYPPYSLPTRPFSWLMLENWDGCTSIFRIPLDEDKEPVLDFKTSWIQDASNHREIFKYFYHDVIPKKSLCILYAKQVPFVEDNRRVIMGIGFVEKIVPAVEHNHTDEGDLRSMTWETMVCHSIRSDGQNGFLFPYQELMAYAEKNPDFDISTATVFATDEYRDEFSYATEHVSYDAVIDVLLQSLKALEVIQTKLGGQWSSCARWVKDRLKEVWLDRGVFPGLGPMLFAFGFDDGLPMAECIKAAAKDQNQLEVLEEALQEPKKYFPPEIVSALNPTIITSWKNLFQERKELFSLLARFSLTVMQAFTFFNIEERKKNKIDCSDKEILDNPYILYEKTRDKEEKFQIPIHKVDLTVFPYPDLEVKYPLTAPSAMQSTNDERRIRALSVSVLEDQAELGHTVYPKDLLTLEINALPLQQPCKVTGDIYTSIDKYLQEEIISIKMKSGETAYQLVRLNKMDELIRKVVGGRVKSKNRHVVAVDWAKIVDKAFEGSVLDDDEKLARQEKSAILKELAEARFSVLVGGAGTGKTTLLSLLCSAESVKNGGILLLAPTGKARVKLGQAMTKQGINCEAKTVAQFLMSSGRFDFNTMQYQLSNIEAKGVPDTVIVDECSMLTEEMFAALLQAIRMSQRIIFVGDPNQLPPIGASRPFVDVVQYLSKDVPDNKFPKVGNSYGELTITRRQQGSTNRLDVELAKWFTSNKNQILDADIFAKLQGNTDAKHLEFKGWKTSEELEKLLLTTLAEEIGMKDEDDLDGFNRSLGSKIDETGTYFNLTCAECADDWQILAPVRNMPHGVFNLNHLIHLKYRADFLNLAKRKYSRKISRPLGPESIVYGDKVINTVNKKRDAYPKEKGLNYVANGEVGIAATCFGRNTNYLHIVYSSQPNCTYSYDGRDFGVEREAILELAYALTVHKAQGSEFKKVILVLSDPCFLMSRELLYTALTRQLDKLVILYNKDAFNLRSYASDACSDIARRFTNLFGLPSIINHNGHYYEEGLIHRTADGKLVRSKSEVIIANALYGHHIDYEYEKEFEKDGVFKIPDFTIENPDSGDTFYWEHCGMMNNEKYKQHWEEKKKFYKKCGIKEGKNLIVTYDGENGGIDSQVVEKMIKTYLE